MSLKGGYKIIDLKNNDLTSSNTIDGVYDAIEGNYGKPILLSGIVIDGVEKDDIFVNIEVSGSDYIIKAYDRTITITSSDVVTSVEGGNHLYFYKMDFTDTDTTDDITLYVYSNGKLEDLTFNECLNHILPIGLSGRAISDAPRFYSISYGSNENLMGIITDLTGAIASNEVSSSNVDNLEVTLIKQIL